jgi:hypothetical protein
MARRRESYTIHLDGIWTIDDLYTFPRAVEQVYFLLWSLRSGHDEVDAERIERAYSTFPWQGGYSAVSFYNQLKFVVPKRNRLRVLSIKYESPGWIELAVVAVVAANLERIVRSVARSIRHCNDVYHRIWTGLEKRKLLRLKVKRAELTLKRDEEKFINQSLKEMTAILETPYVRKLNRLTGDPYISLKILLSLYRRVRTLANYQNQRKVDFRNEK